MDGGEGIDPTGFIRSRSLKFPSDRTYLTGKLRKLLRQNDYERALTAAALKVTRAGDTVFDLGCGLGFVSGMLAKRRKVAAIHAFDGNPSVLTFAEAMLATNGIRNVTLHHAVLGKRKAKVPFYILSPFAASSLHPDANRKMRKIEVEMRNFKTTLAELKPTVIICDIQGDEANLFDGARLDGVRQLVVRLHPKRIGHAGMHRLFASITKAGLAYDPRISAGNIVGFVAA